MLSRPAAELAALLLRAGVVGALAACLWVQPALATASLECSFDDKSATLTVQAVVSRGVGEGIHQLNGEFETKVKGAPDDLRKLAFEQAHLSQSWLNGADLRLRLYRERADDKPHGYVDIVIVTRRKGRDEDAPYTGTYELTVYYLPAAEGSDGKTVKARGKVECSAG